MTQTTPNREIKGCHLPIAVSATFSMLLNVMQMHTIIWRSMKINQRGQHLLEIFGEF
jgi:hypothetical protein